ncbi:hypothetical protein GYB57_07055 [bacterium]|nr:hypothetical protein [bacterium]
MKKTILLLSAVIVLAGVAYYISLNDKKSTIREEFTDFAVKDTADVVKFRITSLNESATLAREGNHWKVNNKHIARPDAVNLILKTFNQIEVLNPVSDLEMSAIIKYLSSSAVKVEIFTNKSGDKPVKVWYVGMATESNMGTYMLLEKGGQKSSRPMVTHLPSNFGYLSSRFFTKESLWRNPIAMQMPAKEIKSIIIESPSKEHPEYKFEHFGDNQFQYTDLLTGAEVKLSPEKAIPYFKRASSLAYEYEDINTEKEIIDSIFNSTPQYLLTLERMNGEIQTLKTFWMPVKKDAKDLQGRALQHHNERMYAQSSINEGRALVVQNYLFDQILKPFDGVDSLAVDK